MPRCRGRHATAGGRHDVWVQGGAADSGMAYFLGNWRFWAGVVVSVVTLALLMLLVDRDELWHALKTANYLYLAPAIVLYFVGQWFRALRWQYLLSPIARISAMRLYPVIIIGYLANNLLPARLGEGGEGRLPGAT